jgi:hypothetical protein
MAETAARAVTVEIRPHVVGFYQRMGGRHLRDSEPTAFGRIIPVMELDLAD